jgi:SPP1 gp7 family putative phage head morphogenesis protein
VKKRPHDISYPDYVLEYLNGYDPVTGYIYTQELDRKRMRLNEGIMAAREFNDRNAFEKAVKKTADLLYTQSMQYGTDLMQAAMLEVYERAGIDELMWVSVMDGRECDECHDRNGVVYKRKEYPGKPHYGCRCYPVPVVRIP